jgi:hypothetical protein
VPSYSESISNSRLVKKLGYERSSGDSSYNGTVLEVYDEKGNELFHVIADESTGDKQIWFSPGLGDLRLSISDLLEALRIAEDWVAVVPPYEGPTG